MAEVKGFLAGEETKQYGEQKRSKVWLILLVIILVVLPVLVTFQWFLHSATSEVFQQAFPCNESQLLEEKLRQSQESFLEMETRWWSCSNDSRDLNKTLEELASQRNLLYTQLQELQEENLDLTNKLKETEAALQMEREKKSRETNSALLGPQTSSCLLGFSLAIVLLSGAA